MHVVSSRQASGRGDNDESLGTKQLSSITHLLVSVRVDFKCCILTCHQTGIWLWKRPLWKWSISGSCKSIDVIYKHGWLDFVDAACRWWTIYLTEKLFCFLNGVVTKNRALTKPSCQTRRLSKFKLACLIYLYSFVCSTARRVPSFVEACLCYAHGYTFLALSPLPSPKPTGMAF